MGGCCCSILNFLENEKDSWIFHPISMESKKRSFWWIFRIFGITELQTYETCLLQHLHAECQHTRCCRSLVTMRECWTDMWPLMSMCILYHMGRIITKAPQRISLFVKKYKWRNQFRLPWSICGFESFSRDMTFLARSAPWRRDAGGSPKGESSRKFGSKQLNALHNLSLRRDLFF